MNWPLVSRRAYDAVLDERDRLRKVNDDLTDHLTRLVRTSNGLTERKIEPKAPDPMPREVQAAILKWPGNTRTEIGGRAWKLHRDQLAQGMEREESWRKVLAFLQAGVEE